EAAARSRLIVIAGGMGQRHIATARSIGLVGHANDHGLFQVHDHHRAVLLHAGAIAGDLDIGVGSRFEDLAFGQKGTTVVIDEQRYLISPHRPQSTFGSNTLRPDGTIHRIPLAGGTIGADYAD